jgi:hypothetical protein
MADTKGSALTNINDVQPTDKIYIIDDPAGTPTSKIASVQEVLKTTNVLAALSVVDKADRVMVIDDPSGTPTPKYATVEDILQAAATLDQNTTPAKTDRLAIVDDPGGTPKAEYLTLATLFGLFGMESASDADSDNTDVLATGISSGVGVLIVGVSTDTVCAIYRIEGSTLTVISANAEFSTSKDTGSKYNVYYETDQYKVQNNVGDNKNIEVIFIGV